MISAINSLTLSPALACIAAEAHQEKKNWFFRGFNKYFAAAAAYSRSVGGVLSRKTLMMGIYITLLLVTGVLFRAVPTASCCSRTSST